MALRQKQIKNLSFVDLAALSASTLVSPEYAYIESENKHYTRIAGVNTIVNPSSGSGGSGTVTSVSVVSANGLTGSVNTSTTTPLITLGTSLTTLVKGNGTGFISAVAGTDYLVPNTAITSSTGTKITYDSKGFITSSTNATATDIVNTPSGNTTSTTVQSAITELQTDIDLLTTSVTGKQSGIQFKDESVNLGSSSTVDTIDFTGNAVTATRVGNVVTVNVAATSSVANLSYTPSATNGIVVSDTGSDATIPLSTTLLAGLESPTDKTKSDLITATVPVNLDTLASNSVTLSGAQTITGVKTFTAQPVGIDSTSIINTPVGNIAAITTQAAINELDTEKQKNIIFQEEGVSTGLSGSVDTINFIGTGITVTQVGSVLTITTVAASSISKYAVPVTGSGGITCRVYGDLGITCVKTNASTITFTIPAGKYMSNFELFYPSAENPGSTCTHVFNYPGNTVINQGLSTTDLPDYKGWFASGIPTTVYHARAVGSANDFVSALLTTSVGSITMLLTYGTTGLSSGDIIMKGNF